MGHYFLKKIEVKALSELKCSLKNSIKYWFQRRKYSFDERDTWAMDSAFFCWLYERLKMYLKCSSEIIDLEFDKFEYNGVEYTQLQLITILLEKLEEAFWEEDIGCNISIDLEREICEIWKILCPSMWW